MKKLHALLPLVAQAVRPAALESIRGDMRDLKRAFSSSRDQQVLAALLAEFLGDEAREGGIISPSLSQRRLRELRGAARSLVRRLRVLQLRELAWEDVARACARTYAKARRQYQRTLRKPSVERLHRWRGPVKDHYFQALILLRDPSRCRRAARLGSRLGRLHDLALLRAQLECNGPGGLIDRIGQRMKKKQVAAFRVARKLFSASSRKMERAILRQTRKR